MPATLPKLLRARSGSPTHVTLDLADGPTNVRVRHTARARRMTLRHDAATGEAVLTLPDGVPIEAGFDFLQAHSGWIASRRRKHGPALPFEPGLLIPLRDVPHRLEHRSGQRGRVTIDNSSGADPVVSVPGHLDHFSRRVSDWLKRQAKSDLETAVEQHAKALGARPARIGVRDQKSRWGSCASNGNLAFSWRLILAPAYVLDYVAAHEVAHLRELNHSDRFWRLVHELTPYVDRAESWLRSHGAKLHRYGRDH